MKNVHRQLRRMATANVLAKTEGTYQNDYRTWTSVNKEFYRDVKMRNEAWKLQRGVLERMQVTKKKQILDRKIDINTAPIEHIQQLDIPAKVLKDLIEMRQQTPFRRIKDLKNVYGLGDKLLEKIEPFLQPLQFDVRCARPLRWEIEDRNR